MYWFKIQRISCKIFGARGSSIMKLFHVTCRQMLVITWVQILGGTTPLKFGRAKNVQNLIRFTVTSDFDSEYLWTG